MIMEAEKSFDLLSASWSSRKAGGVVLFQISRPENQGSQWCKSQVESEAMRTRTPDV